MKIKCDKCGKKFQPGNRPGGLPNGVGFQLENGTIINVCSDCICDAKGDLEWWVNNLMKEGD